MLQMYGPRQRFLRASTILALCVGSMTWASAAHGQSASPSLYLGLGTGTNIGGTVGVGLELPFKQRFSASAALGLWPEALKHRVSEGGALDFDVGLKAFPFGPFFFAGVNYGIINAEYVRNGTENSSRFRKRHGFTFSLGLRTPSYRGVHLSGFGGFTSDAQSNYVDVFDRQIFVPHFGVTIGYEISLLR